MLVLISYDISTTSKEGPSRLRKVSKVCVNYGQRVQCSLFECMLDYAQFLKVKSKILAIMEPNEDSVRFYLLGNNYSNKVEHYGVKPSFSQDDVLIL